MTATSHAVWIGYDFDTFIKACQAAGNPPVYGSAVNTTSTGSHGSTYKSYWIMAAFVLPGTVHFCKFPTVSKALFVNGMVWDMTEEQHKQRIENHVACFEAVKAELEKAGLTVIEALPSHPEDIRMLESYRPQFLSHIPFSPQG